jgi:predicted enzyme related to lactoylglutathione lyase
MWRMPNRPNEDGDLRLELFVEDIERSVDFYIGVLGFTRGPTTATYIPVQRGRVVFGIGLARNLPPQHPLRQSADERLGIGVEIVLEVADVDAVYRAVIDAGWPVHTPVEERPWGLRDFRLSDPDGYYIRVTSTGG